MPVKICRLILQIFWTYRAATMVDVTMIHTTQTPDYVLSLGLAHIKKFAAPYAGHKAIFQAS